MWDLPRAGLEPVSPALAGGFLTTAPPGKSLVSLLAHGNQLGVYWALENLDLVLNRTLALLLGLGGCGTKDLSQHLPLPCCIH